MYVPTQRAAALPPPLPPAPQVKAALRGQSAPLEAARAALTLAPAHPPEIRAAAGRFYRAAIDLARATWRMEQVLVLGMGLNPCYHQWADGMTTVYVESHLPTYLSRYDEVLCVHADARDSASVQAALEPNGSAYGFYPDRPTLVLAPLLRYLTVADLRAVLGLVATFPQALFCATWPGHRLEPLVWHWNQLVTPPMHIHTRTAVEEAIIGAGLALVGDGAHDTGDWPRDWAAPTTGEFGIIAMHAQPR